MRVSSSTRCVKAYRRWTLGSTVQRRVCRPGGTRRERLVCRSVAVRRASTLPSPSCWSLFSTFWTADAVCKGEASRVSGVELLSHSFDTVDFAETKALGRYDPFTFQKIDKFQKSSGGVYHPFLLCSCPNRPHNTPCRARIQDVLRN